MTKRDFLRSELLRSIQEYFASHSFKLNKANSTFTKKNKDGWHKFELIFLLRDNGWNVKLGELIRLDQIEDIYHQTSGFEKKYQKGTPTLALPIISDKGERPVEFDLNEEGQINSLGRQIEELFERYALPFFALYPDLDAVDRALNDNPFDVSLTGHVFKGSKGLIVAKLTNRENYHDLISIYTKQYEEQDGGFYLPEFKKLIINLAKIGQMD